MDYPFVLKLSLFFAYIFILRQSYKFSEEEIKIRKDPKKWATLKEDEALYGKSFRDYLIGVVHLISIASALIGALILFIVICGNIGDIVELIIKSNKSSIPDEWFELLLYCTFPAVIYGLVMSRNYRN